MQESFILRQNVKRDRINSIPPSDNNQNKKFAPTNEFKAEFSIKRESEIQGPMLVKLVQDVEVPILNSLNPTKISEFFDAHGNYLKHNGTEHATHFMDMGLKTYVTRMNFDIVPTDDQLAEYIFCMGTRKKWTLDEIRAKTAKVKLDNSKPTSEEKIHSLLFAMERVLYETNMLRCSSEHGELGISAPTHIRLLQDKLPSKLKKTMEAKMEFVVGSKRDVRTYVTLLLQEAENYSWK